jgi:DNA-binding NtrC family response regulator
MNRGRNMQGRNILVVDRSLQDQCHALVNRGYRVDVVSSNQSAIEKAEINRYDVVLTELLMPEIEGIGILRHFADHSPQTTVIIVTGDASIKSAVRATKLGAFDYLTKPVETDEILSVIEKALKAKDQGSTLEKPEGKRNTFSNIIGNSQTIRQIFEIVEKIADTDSTILLVGESGTGKELIAKAIHYNSSRRNRSLVAVNCGAIPEELLESELFGHEKGAFTNAVRTRIGRFELAHEGTIFLDEISNMSPKLQVKLLRVLQEYEFERVGGNKGIKIDVRVISATNRDLRKKVAEGTFREDLFYRLNVIPIHIPPLRERMPDIPLLVNHFLNRFNSLKKRNIEGITPAAMECLIRHDWPGNVRELENLMERLVILKGEGMITIEDLPQWTRSSVIPVRERLSKSDTTPASLQGRSLSEIEIPSGGVYFNTQVAEFERNLILQALEKSGGVKNRAAQLLHLNRTTLIEKMKRRNLMSL